MDLIFYVSHVALLITTDLITGDEIYIFMYIYIYNCIFIYIYIHIHMHLHTYR